MVKKLIFLSILLFTVLSLTPTNIQAQVPLCDESVINNPDGTTTKSLVPCGNTTKNVYQCWGTPIPPPPSPDGSVYEVEQESWTADVDGTAQGGECNRVGYENIFISNSPIGQVPACRCELAHIFILILNVYNFIVWYIATPLAALGIIIGGVLLLVSGGNPNLAGRGKDIMWSTVIGILIIFGSWIIVNVVMMAIGYQGAWQSFPI